MKQKLFFYLPFVLMVLINCCQRGSHQLFIQEKGKSQTCLLYLLHQIDSLGSMGEYDKALLIDYIAKAQEFGTNYTEDKTSVEFLYKAGLFSMTLAKISDDLEEKELYCAKAINIFDGIQLIYPEFSGIKNCILNKGIIFDEILRDYKNAEILYREFIARYPADSLVINIESYLQYLGKSPEEILSEY